MWSKGNFVAGVIGLRALRFDMWGPDVLAANKVESKGQFITHINIYLNYSDTINVAKYFYNVLFNMTQAEESHMCFGNGQSSSREMGTRRQFSVHETF